VEGAEAEEVARAAVIRLRMLDDIGDAARLWNAFRPAGATGPGPASNLGAADAATSAAAAAAPLSAGRAVIAAQAAASLRDAWRKRIGSVGSRSYRLAEPLLALHGVILREVGDWEVRTAK